MKSTLLSILCLAILVNWSLPLTTPDGYLLVFKDTTIYTSLYKVNFDGTVQRYWNFTLNYPHTLYSFNLFAVDTKDQLVYLGVMDRFLALDLLTGKVAVNKTLKAPNLMFFWNYDYIAEENAIYGVCTGNDQWNWCRVKLGVPNIKLEFLYEFPGTSELGPISDIYYMDKVHQSIWFFSGISYAFGVNYTTGEIIFKGNQTYSDDCIVHDHKLNRTFTITTGVLLAELHPWPGKETKLLNLPTDLRTAYDGMCVYDQETHTLIAVMSNDSIYLNDKRPTYLLLIDVVSLSYKSVALPEFRKWKDYQYLPVTGVKYMKT